MRSSTEWTRRHLRTGFGSATAASYFSCRANHLRRVTFSIEVCFLDLEHVSLHLICVVLYRTVLKSLELGWLVLFLLAEECICPTLDLLYIGMYVCCPYIVAIALFCSSSPVVSSVGCIFGAAVVTKFSSCLPQRETERFSWSLRSIWLVHFVPNTLQSFMRIPF